MFEGGGKNICWQCSMKLSKRSLSTRSRAAQNSSKATGLIASSTYRHDARVWSTLRGILIETGPKIKSKHSPSELHRGSGTSDPAFRYGQASERKQEELYKLCSKYLRSPIAISTRRVCGRSPPCHKYGQSSLLSNLTDSMTDHGMSLQQALSERQGSIQPLGRPCFQEVPSQERWRSGHQLIGKAFLMTREAYQRRGCNVHLPTCNSVRMFSTATPLRAALSKQSFITEKPPLPPSQPKPSETSRVTESPIRIKLQQFQQALDDTTEENKAALGIAFSLMKDLPTDDQTVEEHDEHENDENSGENNYRNAMAPKPGDLIEVHKGSYYILGVVTAVFPRGPDDASSQLQVMTVDGLWTHDAVGKYNSGRFILKRFASPDEYQALKKYLPNRAMAETGLLMTWNPNGHGIPNDVSAPMTRKMEAFRQAADDIYRSHAQKIDSVFDLVAKEQDRIFLTLEQITRKVLAIREADDLPAEARYTIYKALRRQSDHFLEDRHLLDFHTFGIVSQKDNRMIEQVRQWTREHCELYAQRSLGAGSQKEMEHPSVVDRFVAEVRPIILESRRNRTISWPPFVGTSKLQRHNHLQDIKPYEITSGPTMSSETSLILRFLMLWSVDFPSQVRQHILSLPGNVILKAVGMYQNELGLDNTLEATCAIALLEECGVLSPWYNPAASGAVWRNAEAEVSLADYGLTGSKLTETEDAIAKDQMKELRHDWGDMRVFCVDSALTQLVDDGISMEKCPEPDTYWMHCHISNPTAFIDYRSDLASYLQKKTVSEYLPDGVRGMFPFDQMSDRFSLRNGQPVLTFSTKINLDGMILDRQIRNGVINNVTHLTYDTCTKILNANGVSNDRPIRTRYSVGEAPDAASRHDTQDSLSNEHVEELQMMAQLVAAWSRRLRSWRFATRSSGPQVSVNGPTFEEAQFTNFKHFIGDPSISLSVSPTKFEMPINVSLTKDDPLDLVEGAMLMAGNTAANWCALRGIHAPFRGSTYSSNVDLHELALRPAEPSSKTPAAYVADRLRYLDAQITRTGIQATRMIAHDALGLDGYQTVTSPLRRFSDMISHWQIETALRREAKLGRKLTEFDPLFLPFTIDKLDQIAKEARIKDYRYDRRHVTGTEVWLRQFFHRAAICGECKELQDTFTFYVSHVLLGHAKGLITELDYQTSVEQPIDLSMGIQPGEAWTVKAGMNSKTRIVWIPIERIA